MNPIVNSTAFPTVQHSTVQPFTVQPFTVQPFTVQPTVKEKTENNMLDQVQSGMVVYDAAGENVGEVTFVYLGATTATEREYGEGAATTKQPAEAGENSIIGMLADAFDPQDMPTEMVKRLRYSGYLRIDSKGLFASDRFATAEQIAAVTENEVQLNVAYVQLLRR